MPRPLLRVTKVSALAPIRLARPRPRVIPEVQVTRISRAVVHSSKHFYGRTRGVRMRLLIVMLLFLSLDARAGDAYLALFERLTVTTRNYEIEVSPLSVRSVSSVRGTPMQQIHKYMVKNGKLINGPNAIIGAIEVLYQCSVDGVDLVIVRVERDSLFGPIKILSALSGHPVQINKIVALEIKNDKVIAAETVIEKESSFHWRASVLK